MERAAPFQIASAGLVAMMLAGCGAARQAVAPPAAAPAVVTAVPLTTALSPAAYMQLVASSSLFAVRASELVVERSRDPRLRDVARTIAEDQRGIGAQLNFAGRRLDLLPSATLTDTQAADLDRLRSSRDVDRLYRQVMDKALSRALNAHATFAVRGPSPTLKPVANMAAPATRRNLQQLRRR
jgi:predicted outer membrane protein